MISVLAHQLGQVGGRGHGVNLGRGQGCSCNAVASIKNTVARSFSNEAASAQVKPPKAQEDRKITAMELQHMRRKGKKISMVTAYDYPSVRR
jgi:hypothetical protein